MLFQKNFKLQKPNKFAYTPVYYNERKEDLERKIRAAKDDKDALKELNETELRNRIREKISVSRGEELSLANFKKKHKSKSNFTLIFVVLLMATILVIQMS